MRNDWYISLSSMFECREQRDEDQRSDLSPNYESIKQRAIWL